jgi:archaellum component FlaC
MDSEFINRYIEIISNELTRVTREKMILQTQYEVSLNKIKELEKNIEDLNSTVVKLEKKNTSTTSKKTKESDF